MFSWQSSKIHGSSMNILWMGEFFIILFFNQWWLMEVDTGVTLDTFDRMNVNLCMMVVV